MTGAGKGQLVNGWLSNLHVWIKKYCELISNGFIFCAISVVKVLVRECLGQLALFNFKSVDVED